MKAILAIFLFLNISLTYNDMFISYIITEDKITFNYADGRKDKRTISKCDNFEYFCLNTDTKIYLNPEVNAVIETDLSKQIIEKIPDPKNEPRTLPIIDIALLIDSNGVVIQKGVKKPSTESYYNDESLKILEGIDVKAKPAKINQKSVASIAIVRINFYSMDN